MVGIVLVGHCELADEFHNVVKSIVGEVDNLSSVILETDEPSEVSMKKISAAIREVNDGDGVLVLTDMFGGTPSNLSLSFLEEGQVEVLTGTNLPMLIRLITIRRKGNKLSALAKELKSYGKKNIFIASELLKKQDLEKR